ncbi:MAG: sodium:calcium symporter [Phycisphaerae bacterium SM23_30]|nr:MAG: sodium:calcium symporter [Phycisphaerae bacterium SM23_30]
MENQIDTSVHQRFSSRWAFLLSAIGIAVGTGNIWRFPRIVAKCGENGAGAFLIAWVIFLFLWSIPLIIAEYALGQKFRQGVVGTISRAAGKTFTWMGAFIAFVSTAITFFYSVVVGWVIYYFVRSIFTELPLTEQAAQDTWRQYQDGYVPLLTHAVVMVIGTVVIWKGIKSIEKVNKILIPTLLGIVILAVIRSLTLPNAFEGIRHLFTLDVADLAKTSTWIEALTQNAWDTGAGWGLFLTYAAYMKREHGAVKNAFTTGIGNNTVSLLAALMVFGTAFSICSTQMNKTPEEIIGILQTSGEAGTGITFIWMPVLFEKMSIVGRPLCALFFLGLMFAGFSSLIAMLELPTRVFVDAGFKRPVAIGLVVGVSYLLGIPSAINTKLLSNQDFVWGVALMISGGFVAFTIIRQHAKNVRTQDLVEKTDWKLHFGWDYIISIFVPLAALVLLGWWLYQAATIYDPDYWYNPLRQESFMTCLVQWTVILLIFILLNRWMSRRMIAKSELQQPD